MKSIKISNRDFKVISEAFGKEFVSRAKNNGKSVKIAPVNNVFADRRPNSLGFSIYLDECGYCIRRNVSTAHIGPKQYQMFRSTYNNSKEYPNYVFKHFPTIEAALFHLGAYGINLYGYMKTK